MVLETTFDKMVIVETLFYYLFYSSVIFVNAINFEHAVLSSNKINSLVAFLVKNTIIVFISAAVSFLFMRLLLVPKQLTELTPLLAVLIFIVVVVAYALFWQTELSKMGTDLIFPFLCVLFSLSETTHFTAAMFYALCPLFAYCVLLLILYTVRNRLTFSNSSTLFSSDSLILLSVALVMVIFFSWGVSWLSPAAAQ